MMTQFSPRTRIEVIGFALLVAAIWLLVPITNTTH